MGMSSNRAFKILYYFRFARSLTMDSVPQFYQGSNMAAPASGIKFIF